MQSKEGQFTEELTEFSIDSPVSKKERKLIELKEYFQKKLLPECCSILWSPENLDEVLMSLDYERITSMLMSSFTIKRKKPVISDDIEDEKRGFGIVFQNELFNQLSQSLLDTLAMKVNQRPIENPNIIEEIKYALQGETGAIFYRNLNGLIMMINNSNIDQQSHISLDRFRQDYKITILKEEFLNSKFLKKIDVCEIISFVNILEENLFETSCEFIVLNRFLEPGIQLPKLYYQGPNLNRELVRKKFVTYFPDEAT